MYVNAVLLKVMLKGLLVALIVRFAGSPWSDVAPDPIVAYEELEFAITHWKTELPLFAIVGS